MLAAGIGLTGRRTDRAVDGELGTEHRGQPHLPGGLGEADHAVEAVVVGEGQRFEPEPGRLLGQLLGM